MSVNLSKGQKISLKKEDPFEDNELVKVLTQKEYEELLNTQISEDKAKEYVEVLESKDAQIKELQDQINTLKISFFDDVDSLKEQITYKDELLQAKNEIYELNKKITRIDDERVAIFK